MSVVNFNITDQLERQINQVIKRLGLNSRAEFFRFAAVNFMMNLDQSAATDDEYERVMKDLSTLIKSRFKNKKLPSLETQFKDIC